MLVCSREVRQRVFPFRFPGLFSCLALENGEQLELPSAHTPTCCVRRLRLARSLCDTQGLSLQLLPGLCREPPGPWRAGIAIRK